MRALTVLAATAGFVLVPGGAVEHGPALYLNEGDLIGVRNIQGGVPADPNLDLGAGTRTARGDVSINFDIGRRTLIYDGDKHLLASIGPDGIWFFRKPHICRATRASCR